LLAIAGGAAGGTIAAEACLGCGTTRRGGAVAATAGAAATGALAGAVALAATEPPQLPRAWARPLPWVVAGGCGPRLPPLSAPGSAASRRPAWRCGIDRTPAWLPEPAWRWGTGAPALNVAAHLLRLIRLDRAGVRFGLGYANRCQSVQDGSALDFQFPRQIVDSNFAHPPLFFRCQTSLRR